MTIKIITKNLKEYPLVSIDTNGLYVTIKTGKGLETILLDDVKTWKIDTSNPVLVTPRRRKE